MGLLSAQFATCYKCEKQDKKGSLQRCLGWQLLKRLEDDAATFNAIQADAAKEDGRGGSQGLSPAGGDASAGESQPAAEPASLTAAVQDAAAAAPAEQELRETKRFQLFNRGASLQNFAHCPFQVRSPCAALHAASMAICTAQMRQLWRLELWQPCRLAFNVIPACIPRSPQAFMHAGCITLCLIHEQVSLFSSSLLPASAATAGAGGAALPPDVPRPRRAPQHEPQNPALERQEQLQQAQEGERSLTVPFLRV